MLCTGVLSPGSHSRQPQIYQDCIGHDPLVKIKAFLYFYILLNQFLPFAIVVHIVYFKSQAAK